MHRHRAMPVIVVLMLMMAGCGGQSARPVRDPAAVPASGASRPAGPAGAQQPKPGTTQPPATKPTSSPPPTSNPTTRPTTAVVPPVAMETKWRINVTGEPVDWDDDESIKTTITSQPNACATGQTTENAPWLLEVRGSGWRPHPVSKGRFLTPSIDVAVCNGSDKLATKSLNAHTAGDKYGSFPMPELRPGEGVLLRFFSSRGYPSVVADYWRADDSLWPEWTIKLIQDEQLVTEVTVPRGPVDAIIKKPYLPILQLPLSPTVDQLRQFAWGQGKVSGSERRQVELFLYARDAQFSIATYGNCISGVGGLNASGEQWQIYASVDGKTPFVIREMGKLGFEGGRHMSVAEVPGQNFTVLLFQRFGSCSSMFIDDIYHYDHVLGIVYRPQMQWLDGKKGNAVSMSTRFTAEGKLTARTDGQSGQKPLSYQWDDDTRTWVEEQVKR